MWNEAFTIHCKLVESTQINPLELFLESVKNKHLYSEWSNNVKLANTCDMRVIVYYSANTTRKITEK